MFEFFAGASPALGLWALGVVILGAALAYGVLRTGWLKPRERTQLDRNTVERQRSEDPQKLSGAARNEPREDDKPDQRTDKPWERPAQLKQNPDWKEPKKPDLERWKETQTH
jgi:hypothetical protein